MTFATTFVVPSDRAMVDRSHAVVVALVLDSHAQATAVGGIETVTTLSVQEVIKGDITESTVDVHEPGGALRGRGLVIPGAPRFVPGDRVLLFLRSTEKGWATTDLALGKFDFRTDSAGNDVLLRTDEVKGWDLDGKPHVEHPRAAASFLEFLRQEARGIHGNADYSSSPAVTSFSTYAAATSYSPTTYTMASQSNSDTGERWAIFPSQVSWYNQNTLSGAPGGGVTAIQSADATWTNDAASNINYVYIGQNSAATGGLQTSDKINGVRFEVNLSSYGAPPYSCSSGGTIAIGGFWTSGTTNTHPTTGETFNTITEGDVDANQGLAACPSFTNSGDFNTALTHELGHTLGFRHSNQDRLGGACPSTFECSSTAVMNSILVHGLNGALQTWDVHAADAVYPSLTSCTSPSITSGPSSVTINAGSSTTLSVTATGTTPLSYQWYIGTSGTTTTPVSGGTGSSITVSPSSTTSYWVRVSNSCGSVNSGTATVTVTSSTTRMRVSTADFSGDSKSDIFLRRQSTSGEDSIWLMNGTTKAVGAYTESAGTNWHVVGIGDFDGDGKADVLWRDPTTGQNAMWLMNGTTKAVGVIIESAGTQWDVAGVGDFDGDGKADIIWRNHNTGENSMWLMNGTTKRMGTYIASAALHWKVVAIGDFDGDGKADILWRDSSTGQNAMWLMNGATKTVDAIIESAATSWDVAGVGDFDGDGKWDIFWRNHNTGENYIWLMNGTTKAAGGYTQTAGLNWTVAAIGDYDGDGKSDVLWRDYGSGSNDMWLMSSTTKRVEAVLESADPSWRIVP
jgi:hypothetical protein